METNTGNIRTLRELEKLHANEKLINEKALSRKVRSELALTGKSKIGRNAKCPCGSDKKFKRCCYTGE